VTVSLWWIRRDIRLQDNTALLEAGKNGIPVIAVFILDDVLMKSRWNRRQRFLISGLHNLKQQLEQKGSGLVIRQGEPVVELQKLMREINADGIFAEEDYSPYARQRDAAVKRVLPLILIQGCTLVHPMGVKKPDGKPYGIFTPFSRIWKSLPIIHFHQEKIPNFVPSARLPLSIPLPQVDEIEGFPATTAEAERRLDHFLAGCVTSYGEDRDRMDLDGTSRLSPYIKFGMVSIRKIIAVIRDSDGYSDKDGKATWLNELIWREFYQSILYHYPRVKKEAFNARFRQIAWRDSPDDLRAWKEGQTGYPVVDAAMRQLFSTGWMHNRARMITASFLTKDLLINWQEGERWFMHQLVDGDTAANNGGWQWTAGTGTDAAPYFRIFNPVLQSRKFDPTGAYIRLWIPELRELPDEWLYEPWRMPEHRQKEFGVFIGKTYPSPIVDHTLARDRAMQAYRSTG
jgi:deoxyribodipyrimidine photo-lyase